MIVTLQERRGDEGDLECSGVCCLLTNVSARLIYSKVIWLFAWINTAWVTRITTSYHCTCGEYTTDQPSLLSKHGFPWVWTSCQYTTKQHWIPKYLYIWRTRFVGHHISASLSYNAALSHILPLSKNCIFCVLDFTLGQTVINTSIFASCRQPHFYGQLLWLHTKCSASPRNITDATVWHGS